MISSWIIAAALVCACEDAWTIQKSGSDARLRGVCAVSDQVAWAAGNRGTVLRTIDGGAHWQRLSVPESEALDFRDVEAVDANTACVLAIGPGEASRIYRTEDGGGTWSEAHRMRDPRGFLDAIDFWDVDHGIALGDPIDGRFTILVTGDGGKHWNAPADLEIPPSLIGEGAFAASGTCLVTFGERHAWFATGGAGHARVFHSSDRGRTWAVAATPIDAGNASSGVFSLVFFSEKTGVAVGGDYQKPDGAGPFAAITDDGGTTWKAVENNGPCGYRSGMAAQADSTIIAVGPTGCDISRDAGARWTSLSDLGFHAIATDRKSGTTWAVGENGTIAKR